MGTVRGGKPASTRGCVCAIVGWLCPMTADCTEKGLEGVGYRKRALPNTMLPIGWARCRQQRAMLAQRSRKGQAMPSTRSPLSKILCDKKTSSWRHISYHTDKNRYYT